MTQRYVLFPGKLPVGKHGAPPLNQQENNLFSCWFNGGAPCLPTGNFPGNNTYRCVTAPLIIAVNTYINNAVNTN